MKKILIVSGRYIPGYKDGGPVRTIKNMIDRLGSEYEFYILTADRDVGDTEPYPDIVKDGWTQVGPAKVWYTPPGGVNAQLVNRLAEGKDLVLLTGCFADYARVVLNEKHKGNISAPLYIFAFGLFTPGAFRIKYPKKKAYMVIMGLLGMFRNVEWIATSEDEAADIRRQAGKEARCHIAEDLPRAAARLPHGKSSDEGELRVVFLSRISRKKNLVAAAKVLAGVKGKITFDIYGNEEDPVYLAECREELNRLPENITWRFCGEAAAERVPETFAEYDVFLFPTMAENYGHVILEALSGGALPVISDRTPWDEKKLGGNGISIPLEDSDSFTEAIQLYTDMSAAELSMRANAAVDYAYLYMTESVRPAEDAYRRFLNEYTNGGDTASRTN